MIARGEATSTSGIVVDFLKATGMSNIAKLVCENSVAFLAIIGTVWMIASILSLYDWLTAKAKRPKAKKEKKEKVEEKEEIPDCIEEEVWITKSGKKAHLFRDCCTFLTKADKYEVCLICRTRYEKNR